MSLWDWVLLIGAALTLMGPFILGMYAALSRGLGVWAGLVFGFRRFHHRAIVMTLVFLPPTLCMGIVIAMAAIFALIASWTTGHNGTIVLFGFGGFFAGSVIAIKSANRIAQFIFNQIPNNHKRTCLGCYGFLEAGDTSPCAECGEDAPKERCNMCECELEGGEVGPCHACRRVCQHCGYDIGCDASRCPECGESRP
jgi:hypothetical protein